MAPHHRLVFMVLLVLGATSPAQSADGPAAPRSDVVTISEVKVRLTDHGPVILLQAEGKTIPIFVDLTVAMSIQGALSGEQLARPMSHDLMHSILETFGGKVTQTVITLKGSTYYGALTVAFRDKVQVFDSRSSDSIALAVHFNAPIIVERELLERHPDAGEGNSKAQDL